MKGNISLVQVIQLYNQLKEILLDPIPQLISQKPKPLPKLQIVLSGTVNAGKSTLANTLLGSSVLPSSDRVCTSRITVVRASRDKKFRVIVKGKEVHEFHCVEDLEKQLNRIVGSEAKTAFVEVEIEWVGCEMLNKGLEIVDTPGFNENEAVREQSLAFMKNAAVVLFLISREDGCLNTENTTALNILSSAGVVPLFVLNKVDEYPNPKQYRTAAKKEQYKEDTKKIISLVLEGLRNLFPDVSHFFPLSALEAQVALEDKEPFPEPWNNFMNSLASSLHFSLLTLVNNNTVEFLNHVISMMKELSDAETVQKGMGLIDKLIPMVTTKKLQMKSNLLKEVESSIDNFLVSNKEELKEELENCGSPTMIKDSELSANQQTLKFLLHVLQNKIAQHLSNIAIQHYKQWNETFMSDLNPFINDGGLFWDPNSVKLSMTEPAVQSNSLFSTALIHLVLTISDPFRRPPA